MAGPAAAVAGQRVQHPGMVVGRLVDQSGAAIQGALVETLRFREVPEGGILPERTDRRSWTDASGRFRVRQSTDGYLLRACFPDAPRDRRTCREAAQGVPYLGTYLGPVGQTDSWVPQTALFRSRESDRRVGTVSAATPSTVRGRLSGAAFEQVRIMRLNDTVAFRTMADADGRYRFRGMAPGPYYVAAGGQGALAWRSAVFDLEPASTFRVPPASLRRGAVLAGTVTNRAGEPVSGVELLVRRDGSPVAATGTDDTGAFRIPGFTKGSYEVGVMAGITRYAPVTRTVAVASASGEFDASLTVRRGAEIVARLALLPGEEGLAVRDELRDSSGVPILANFNQGGQLRYTGLGAGRYTVVAGTKGHYATRRFRVDVGQRKQLGSVAVDTPTLTLRGRTAPRAVVEATTGDLCPPGGDGVRYGGFHSLEKANADGRYRLTGLVPGTLMLGADGWPGEYAPRCWSGFELTESTKHNLPLVQGAVVRGRLVYAETGTPVITSLGYELVEDRPSATSPTDEHPARGRAARTGMFEIPRLGPATMTGRLAQLAGTDQTVIPRFLATFPLQDGTPYWLASAESRIDILAGVQVDLGDVPLVLHPTPADR